MNNSVCLAKWGNDNTENMIEQAYRINDDIKEFYIETDCNILITPISKKYKSKGACSRKDWEEQMIRASKFEQMMWDDSSRNSSKPGDIFIAWHFLKGVTFHRITEIKSVNERLSSWSTNVGQSDRQVLYITREFASMDWDSWIKIGGHSRCMGTGNVSTAKKNILDTLFRKE